MIYPELGSSLEQRMANALINLIMEYRMHETVIDALNPHFRGRVVEANQILNEGDYKRGDILTDKHWKGENYVPE